MPGPRSGRWPGRLRLLPLSQINGEFARGRRRGREGPLQTIKPESQRQKVATCQPANSRWATQWLIGLQCAGPTVAATGPGPGFQIPRCACGCAARPMAGQGEQSQGGALGGGTKISPALPHNCGVAAPPPWQWQQLHCKHIWKRKRGKGVAGEKGVPGQDESWGGGGKGAFLPPCNWPCCL